MNLDIFPSGKLAALAAKGFRRASIFSQSSGKSSIKSFKSLAELISNLDMNLRSLLGALLVSSALDITEYALLYVTPFSPMIVNNSGGVTIRVFFSILADIGFNRSNIDSNSFSSKYCKWSGIDRPSSSSFSFTAVLVLVLLVLVLLLLVLVLLVLLKAFMGFVMRSQTISQWLADESEEEEVKEECDVVDDVGQAGIQIDRIAGSRPK